MKTNAYAIFEVTPDGSRLRALFPDTGDGVEAAIEWGEDNFDDFHTAEPPDAITGTAYMKKVHGIHIFEPEITPEDVDDGDDGGGDE